MLLATSVYFKSLPDLRDEIAQRMAAAKGAVTFESQLALRGQLQQEVLNFFKQNRSVYRVIHFPFLEKTCPQCQATLTGEHVELANAATGKAVVMSSLVYHGITTHNSATMTEHDLDLGGNVRATRDLVLNYADAIGALKEGTAGPEVIAELNALAASA